MRGGVLRLLIQRKGESWEEKFGYGTSSMDRRRVKGLSLFAPSSASVVKRNYNISMPEDFRLVGCLDDRLVVRVVFFIVIVCQRCIAVPCAAGVCCDRRGSGA